MLYQQQLSIIHIQISIPPLQVISMQCNVEPVEEGAKYHVSLCHHTDNSITYCWTATGFYLFSFPHSKEES